MQLAITNLSSVNHLELSYLEKLIQPGATITFECAQSELSKMVDLQQAVADGRAAYQVVPSAIEVASGVLTAHTPLATSTTPGLQSAQDKAQLAILWQLYGPTALDISDRSKMWYGAPNLDVGFSEWRFDTTHTLLTPVMDFVGQSGGASAINFSSDGGSTWTQLTSAGGTTQTLALGAGTKHCRFRYGLATQQNRGLATITVPHLTSLTGIGGTFTLTPSTAPANQITVVGDSIPAGSGASNIAFDAWPAQLRDRNSVSVTYLGGAGGSLYYLSLDTAATVAAIVATFAGVAGTKTLIMQMCVNDWGIVGTGLWGGNTTNFMTAYNAILSGVRAAVPSVVIICQSTTACSTNEEALVASGKTLDDFRNAIRDNRLSNTTYVNGKTQLRNLPLSDDVHGTTAGYLDTAKGYEFLLGLRTFAQIKTLEAGYLPSANTVNVSGANVVSITDIGPNGLTLTPTGTPATYSATNGPNGQPCIRGAGVAGSSLDSGAMSQTVPLSILALVKWTGTGTRYINDGDLANHNAFYADGANNVVMLNAASGVVVSSVTLPSGWTFYELAFSASAAKSFINGAAGPTGTTGTSVQTKIRLFAEGTGIFPSSDSVALWAMYAGEATTGNRHDYALYMAVIFAMATAY